MPNRTESLRLVKQAADQLSGGGEEDLVIRACLLVILAYVGQGLPAMKSLVKILEASYELWIDLQGEIDELLND